MPATDHRDELIAAYDAAFNGRRLDALDSVFDADMVDRSVAKAADQVGLDAFKARISGHHAGVADLRFDLFDLLVEGELLAFRWTFTGTHTGTWLGRPATNKPFVLPGMNLERFENGRVVEHFSYPDVLGLLRQLGLV